MLINFGAFGAVYVAWRSREPAWLDAHVQGGEYFLRLAKLDVIVTPPWWRSRVAALRGAALDALAGRRSVASSPYRGHCTAITGAQAGGR